MNLATGSSLAHYRLADKLGEGGMGVVWRAHDTTLGRDVALKVLPDVFASDPERLARFEREARLLASLNHPRIAAVYGFHAEGEVRFLAMELAEGESLAQRLERGPLAVDEAIAVARQIAEALEAAHERGIIHRDLKPGNIMLAPDGGVKVLDFGLAKALEGDPAPGSSPRLSQSPTITQAMTSANVILGTAAYMSPEQARGQAVDKRADVWSFGVILFEMLTGRQLFEGDTVSDTLAAVLRAETDWKSLPAATPARVRRLIERCLVRDARQRLRDIGEARILLDAVVSGAPEEPARVAEAAPAARSRLSPVLFAVAGLVAGGVAMAGLGRLVTKSPEVPLRRFVVASPDSASQPPLAPAISPDGSTVAWLVGSTLWVRPLGSVEARPLATVSGIASPFWSPDSRTIGFLSGNRVMKVALSGGDPQIVSDVRKPFTSGSGATWSDDGVILSSRAENDGILEAPSLGGDAHVLLPPDTTAETDFHQPCALPGNRGVVYVVHRLAKGPDTIELLSHGKRRVLFQLEGQTLADPVYSPTGHILFSRAPQNDGIWALPFSLGGLKVTGQPFLVVPNGRQPSVARDGTLVYRAGAGAGVYQISWLDRTGRVIADIGGPEEGFSLISGPVIAPDGVRLAVSQSTSEDEADLWVFDTVRGTKTRLTFDKGVESDPEWSPDGSRIFYAASGADCSNVSCWQIFSRAADGSGRPDTLATGFLPNVSPDGRTLIFGRLESSSLNLVSLPLEPRGPAVDVAAANNDSRQFPGPVSPNGKFVAYVSNESNRSEVYLRRFPSWGGQWQVSTGGGNCPRWNATGNRLYYVHGDDFYEVEIGGGDSPVLGAPHRLFSLQPSLRVLGISAYFDVTRDGQRFVVIRPAGATRSDADVVAVQNWFSEFRGRK